MERKIYTIENLDCANCAAKIESKFNAHPAVEEAVITFATRQLRLTAENPDTLIPELEKLARTVEHGVVIRPREEGHAHHHHEGCSCGQEHHAHHHGEGCGCGHDHGEKEEHKDAHDHEGSGGLLPILAGA